MKIIFTWPRVGLPRFHQTALQIEYIYVYIYVPASPAVVMYSYGPPHMAVQKQGDQHEHTFSNYVRIRDVVQKTSLRLNDREKWQERARDIRATSTT